MPVGTIELVAIGSAKNHFNLTGRADTLCAGAGATDYYKRPIFVQ
jgi:hypothetical protein